MITEDCVGPAAVAKTRAPHKLHKDAFSISLYIFPLQHFH